MGLYVVAALIVLLLCFSVYKLRSSKEVKSLFTPPTVTVSEATLGPVIRYINAIGTLRPYDSVVIKSEVNAKIEKINFSEGSFVEENDLLMELDDSIAKDSLLEAEAKYWKAKSEFAPIDKLADKGIAARLERDRRKADMDMCAAQVSAYRTTLKKHKIYAPFSGMVGLKERSKGEFVSSGAELLKIVDCHPLKVDFKVAEVDIGNVYVGQEIQVLVGGDSTQTFMAKIIAIDPESDKISHSFDVRAILDVPEEVALNSQVLKPGRFVSVKVLIDGNQSGILIPESAIEKVGDDDLVYRVVEGVAIRTLVTPGICTDGNVEILTGINEGDIVITSGQINVLDGKGVTIQREASLKIPSQIVDDFREQEESASQEKL